MQFPRNRTDSHDTVDETNPNPNPEVTKTTGNDEDDEEQKDIKDYMKQA
jgi:hypothetical protein